MTSLKSARNHLRSWKQTHKRRKEISKSRHLVVQLEKILPEYKNLIPVIIVSYNNGVYVDNMVNQLNERKITPIIIDNNSDCDKSRAMLADIEKKNKAHIACSSENFGHLVGFISPVYDLLPEIFAYTDPDLQLNPDLPKDFLNRLAMLTSEFPVFKTGFALSLDAGKLKDTKVHFRNDKPFYYEKKFSIQEFESRYWIKKLQHPELELYAAPIDTTFAVYRKSNYIGEFHDALRVAGKYSALHLPWFTELDLFSEEDRAAYNKHNVSSNWS